MTTREACERMMEEKPIKFTKRGQQDLEKANPFVEDSDIWHIVSVNFGRSVDILSDGGFRYDEFSVKEII